MLKGQILMVCVVTFDLSKIYGFCKGTISATVMLNDQEQNHALDRLFAAQSRCAIIMGKNTA